MRRAGNDGGLRLALMFGSGVLLGGWIEIAAWLLDLYAFQPWWIVLVVVFAAFGIGLGGLTFVLPSRPVLAALLAGSFAFAAEVANALWLGVWVFDGWIVELLPDPFARAGVLAAPVLLAPFIVRAQASGLARAIVPCRESGGDQR